MAKLNIKSFFTLAVVLIVIVLCFISIGFREGSRSKNKLLPADVLVVYSYGSPSKTISEIKPEEADAITTATPSDINVKTIAERIESEFKLKGYKTLLATPNEINNMRDLLQCKMLILGTGVRFWNMTWEMKRMIDIYFGKIYITSKNDFRKIAVGTFAQAEISASALAAINALSAAASDCGSKPVASEVFLTSNNMPADTVMVRIKNFVAEMISGAANKSLND